jgi:hypothetical protein
MKSMAFHSVHASSPTTQRIELLATLLIHCDTSRPRLFYQTCQSDPPQVDRSRPSSARLATFVPHAAAISSGTISVRFQAGRNGNAIGRRQQQYDRQPGKGKAGWQTRRKRGRY